MDGDDVPERREEVIEFWRLRDSRARSAAACEVSGAVVSRAGAMPETVLPATPAVVPTVPALAVVAAVVMLRVLREEEERWRREGVGWLAPEMRWLAWWSVESARPVEVDDELDTTEADCWRRRESSRVRRLTWSEFN